MLRSNIYTNVFTLLGIYLTTGSADIFFWSYCYKQILQSVVPSHTVHDNLTGDTEQTCFGKSNLNEIIIMLSDRCDFLPKIQLQIILFLLFWDVLWIINDLLAPLSIFFDEFQQNTIVSFFGQYQTIPIDLPFLKRDNPCRNESRFLKRGNNSNIKLSILYLGLNMSKYAMRQNCLF